MSNILEFDSIGLRYSARPILSDIYMKCQTGEVVGILGRNGSGKSSLMRVVFGSLKADHRSVRINGTSLQGDYLRQRVIAYLPQGNLIPSFLSIRKALKLFKVSEEEILLHYPEIKAFLAFTPDQLSGGYRRLIETLLLLKSPAQFCILDEPFSGLMPVHIEKLKGIIAAEKDRKGIIITDHIYREVLAIADRLYLLVNGKTHRVKHVEDLIARGYVNTL
jgi:ABC-type multidrug transport system ATPase subunit